MTVMQSVDAITIAREFDAPRELVFEVFTKAEHLSQWFAPKRFSVSHCTIDLRRGGIFHFCMRSPEGAEFWGRGVFQDIVVPEFITYIDTFSDRDGNVVSPKAYGLSDSHPTETLVRIVFEARGHRTLVTLTHGLPEVARERNDAQQGWIEMFDRAADVVLQTRVSRLAS